MRVSFVRSTSTILGCFAILLIVGCLGTDRKVARHQSGAMVLPIKSDSECAVVTSTTSDISPLTSEVY